MVWTVYGDQYENASDLTDQSKFQPVIMPSNSIVIGCRTWVILVDDPTLTSLSMEIYSNRPDGSGDPQPGVLLHTSTNVQTKANILTDNSGNKEIFFNFNQVNLKGGDTYNFVLTGAGYSPTASSFIAWRIAWPDPVYTTNYTPTVENLGRAPKFISTVVAGEL